MNYSPEMDSVIKIHDLLSETQFEVDPVQLTSLATCRSHVIRQAVFNNPSTPPAVKLWLKSYRESVSLEEFLQAIESEN